METGDWVLLGVGVSMLVLAVVAVVIAVVLREPINRKLYPGVDVEGWRRTAMGLPLRDRWELYRANLAGRATTPRLAALAVRRGEVAADMNRMALGKGSAQRRFFIGLGVLMSVLGLLQVALIVLRDVPLLIWPNLWLAILGVLYVLAIGPLQQRVHKRFRRSVEANEALLAQDPDVSPR